MTEQPDGIQLATILARHMIPGDQIFLLTRSPTKLEEQFVPVTVANVRLSGSRLYARLNVAGGGAYDVDSDKDDVFAWRKPDDSFVSIRPICRDGENLSVIGKVGLDG